MHRAHLEIDRLDTTEGTFDIPYKTPLKS
jgi:hypothetical protein